MFNPTNGRAAGERITQRDTERERETARVEREKVFVIFHEFQTK